MYASVFILAHPAGCLVLLGVERESHRLATSEVSQYAQVRIPFLRQAVVGRRGGGTERDSDRDRGRDRDGCNQAIVGTLRRSI